MLPLIAALALLAPAAGAGPVTLHVGVPPEAGGVRDVVADGESGQCTPGPGWLRCPADGPVSFAWGPGGDWVLHGDTTLAPSTEGTAFVWAAPRPGDLARLDPATVDEADVRALFVRYGDNHPTAPSRAMFEALLELAEHPDPLVRRAVVESLHPFLWRSRLGTLPPTAPVPVPDGLLTRLAKDPDKGVRRRVAVLIRDLRPSHLSAEAGEVLIRLLGDPVRGVRRAAHATLSKAVPAEALPHAEAWARALRGVRQPGPPGRAAANTLAQLSKEVEPGPVVDPVAAVAIVLEHHPERAWRVWTAWRDHVPFHRPWVDLLLRDTLGLGPRLMKHWAAEEPRAFAEALRAWEPVEPHSERFELARRYLADVQPPPVREALGLDPIPE